MFEKNELEEFTSKIIEKALDYLLNFSEIITLYISKLKTYFSEISNNEIFSRIKLEISEVEKFDDSPISLLDTPTNLAPRCASQIDSQLPLKPV